VELCWWGDISQHLKEMLVNNNPMMQHHIPQGMNPKQHCCSNQTPCNYLWFMVY
jgi:hypothetical protein